MTVTDPGMLPGSGVITPAGTGAARHVTVLVDRCAGCQECLIRCPEQAISMDSETWVVTVNDDACVGCRQCERTCPFSAITVAGPPAVAPRAPARVQHPAVLVGDTSETRQPIADWEEALTAAERCLTCPDPTCVRGCPVHNDIPAFIAALAQQDLPLAQQVLARTTVFPDVCSRVCDQSTQCEGACTWTLAGDTPVAIGALERFIADHEPVPGVTRVSDDGVGMSVAVIGGGPAAAAAAWDLAAAGASVVIHERDERPGGLLNWGIPDFTLPDAVARRPFDALADAGVEIRCNSEVQPSDLAGMLREHDAVVVAVGASSPLRLPVPGGDLEGVTDATSFLKRAKAVLEGGDRGGLFPELARVGQDTPRVVVIGGGNTAMDVARSARRLGMTATCVEWLNRSFAPVRPDELAEAEAEGVDVRFLTTLTSIEGASGHVTKALLSRTRQDEAGKRPRVLAGEKLEQPADLVVMAMGYRADREFSTVLPGTPVRRVASSGVPDRRWLGSGILSPLAVRSGVGQTALGRDVGVLSAALPFADRLYAAGDALVGPSTVVEAMAQGRRAARAILTGQPRRPGRPPLPPRNVLVCYESQTGTTAHAAELIGKAMERQGAHVTVIPLAQAGAAELAAADLVIAGSWVEGMVVAAVRPARPARDWLAALPRLAGKRVAVFCTYGVAPKGALTQMADAMTAKGAQVLATAAISRRHLERDVANFVSGRVAALSWPGPGRPG